MKTSRAVIALAMACLVLAVRAAEVEGNDKSDTMVYRAGTPDQVWDGWGFASPADPNASTQPVPEPEQFDLKNQKNQAARTFSGRVVLKDQESMDGVEVGLVSLVGIHWIRQDTYQWQPVKPDGSFSITDKNYPTACKALAVRGPETPWTFFRYDFKPGEGAGNIVLKADAARHVHLTASGPDMVDLAGVTYEPFHAYTQYNDQRESLRRQHLDYYETGSTKSKDVVMPAGPVAIFVRCPGYADYYQIVDTRKASNLHFVFKKAGFMKISVLNKDGTPKSRVHVSWVNPNAPLSLWDEDTKASGVLAPDNLVPGTWEVTVDGFEMQRAEVREGAVTELVFQDS